MVLQKAQALNTVGGGFFLLIAEASTGVCWIKVEDFLLAAFLAEAGKTSEAAAVSDGGSGGGGEAREKERASGEETGEEGKEEEESGFVGAR